MCAFRGEAGDGGGEARGALVVVAVRVVVSAGEKVVATGLRVFDGGCWWLWWWGCLETPW